MIATKETSLADYEYYLFCPACGGMRISAGSFEIESIEAWRRVECEDCGYEWDEIFHFSHNEEVE